MFRWSIMHPSSAWEQCSSPSPSDAGGVSRPPGSARPPPGPETQEQEYHKGQTDVAHYGQGSRLRPPALGPEATPPTAAGAALPQWWEPEPSAPPRGRPAAWHTGPEARSPRRAASRSCARGPGTGAVVTTPISCQPRPCAPADRGLPAHLRLPARPAPCAPADRGLTRGGFLKIR